MYVWKPVIKKNDAGNSTKSGGNSTNATNSTNSTKTDGTEKKGDGANPPAGADGKPNTDAAAPAGDKKEGGADDNKAEKKDE